MITKKDFIKKTINLILKQLEKQLPDEDDDLEEMIEKTKKIIDKIYK